MAATRKAAKTKIHLKSETPMPKEKQSTRKKLDDGKIVKNINALFEDDDEVFSSQKSTKKQVDEIESLKPPRVRRKKGFEAISESLNLVKPDYEPDVKEVLTALGKIMKPKKLKRKKDLESMVEDDAKIQETKAVNEEGSIKTQPKIKETPPTSPPEEIKSGMLTRSGKKAVPIKEATTPKESKKSKKNMGNKKVAENTDVVEEIEDEEDLITSRKEDEGNIMTPKKENKAKTVQPSVEKVKSGRKTFSKSEMENLAANLELNTTFTVGDPNFVCRPRQETKLAKASLNDTFDLMHKRLSLKNPEVVLEELTDQNSSGKLKMDRGNKAKKGALNLLNKQIDGSEPAILKTAKVTKKANMTQSEESLNTKENIDELSDRTLRRRSKRIEKLGSKKNVYADQDDDENEESSRGSSPRASLTKVTKKKVKKLGEEKKGKKFGDGGGGDFDELKLKKKNKKPCPFILF